MEEVWRRRWREEGGGEEDGPHDYPSPSAGSAKKQRGRRLAASRTPEQIVPEVLDAQYGEHTDDGFDAF